MNTRALCPAVLVLVLALLAACGRDVPMPRRIVDLSPPLAPDTNQRHLGMRILDFLGTNGQISVQRILPITPALAYGIDRVCLPSHSGSHLDAPARLLRGGEHPAQVPLEDLIGPARLVDLRWHDREAPLQITDLEVTPIESGDIVILFVGYQPAPRESWPRYAPLSAQAAQWLVAKQIRAVATDAPVITRHSDVAARLQAKLPPEEVWAEHIPFFQAQIPVIAGLVNLESIADERDVLFVGLPLPLTDSTGAPLRAAALVY